MSDKYLKRLLCRVLFAGIIVVLAFGAVVAQEEAVQENVPAGDQPVTHVVQAGENLYRIAMRYGVDIEELVRVNDITNRSRIFRGQVLVIPGLFVQVESAAVVENPLIAGTPAIHVVAYGDTLSNIAQRYSMTVEQLLAANNITNPNLIFRGQELQVWTPETVDAQNAPEPEDAPDMVMEGVPPEASTTYIVQPGEHLAQIARRYGMSWTVLASVNGITDPNHVFSGQKLVIPALNTEGGIVDMGILTANVSNAPAPTVSSGKQIIVDLSEQRIYAYEDGLLVRNTLVSTGLPATPTVQGNFTVRTRIRSQRMTGPGYDLPNVEWVQYFYQAYAIHGTYWHNNFGQPMSHGCVNLPNHEAEWFWNWASIGTPVRVQW